MQKLLVAMLAPLAMSAAAQDLILTGVVDGPLSGGVPKAAEIYVANDILDLSQCGIGSANNGGGSDGQEFTFPADMATAGQFIYVASEMDGFTAFFGFAPDYTSGAMSVNGDDAIELFCNGAVIDTFGDIDVDGSGTDWDYLDGWAYRASNTGPDGSAFIASNWTFSGTDALDDATDNGSASSPFPLASYTGIAGDAAPFVLIASPSNGSSGVALDSDINLTFNEAVTVSGTWFALECDSSPVAAIAGTADNINFSIDPASDFGPGQSCQLTVFANAVNDIDADDPPDFMTADYHLSFSTALPMSGVVINEILADPDAALGDANGDGTVSTSQDEFVEIVNTSGADLDLSNWVLSDGASDRHVFPAGTTIGDGCALVLFSGGSPSGDFGYALAQTASTGALGLNNGGDTITLRNDSAVVVATETYGSEGGNNEALTRDPDISGSFVGHSSASSSGGSLYSPGTQADGSLFSGCSAPTLVAIHDVQGPGAASPYVGQTVVVEGIITGDFQDMDADEQSNLRGFYLQEQMPDANPLTSEGIFVFDGSTPLVDVNVGDKVRVTGSVSEYFGDTEITADNVVVLGSGFSVEPTDIALPFANVIVNSDGEYIADLEPWEGMLVRIQQNLTVTEMFNLDRYGEMNLTEGGRIYQFTQLNSPDAAGFDAHLQMAASRSLMLDDGLSIQNPEVLRYPSPGLPNDIGAVLRMGDSVAGLVGNVRFSRSSGGSGDERFRLMPTQEPLFVVNNPRDDSTPEVGGTLKVASLNVLNYFTTIDEGQPICAPLENLFCRGADSIEEFQRQRAKTIKTVASLDADVLGLIEIENNLEAIVDLVGGVNESLGAEVYAYIDTGTIGTDAVRTAIIYKPAKVTPLGAFAILDTSVDERFVDRKNRPTLAQSFSDLGSGEVFTLVVNHLKAKSSDCDELGDPDTGDGQGECNLTRKYAVDAIIDWLATDPTGANTDNVLIMGDMNAYAEEDPITTLEAAGYVDIIETLLGGENYSFVFDGQIGVFDHALASPALLEQVTGVQEWHINVDEADAFDYNLDFGRNPDIFEADNVFRASDHEPVVVGLDLSSGYVEGDLNGDGIVNRKDFKLFMKAFLSVEGGKRYDARADLDRDGFIGFKDLALFLAIWKQ